MKQHTGPVILSGYPSEMYDRELAGWSRIARKSYNRNADQRTEVLWCNFDVPGLFTGIGGLDLAAEAALKGVYDAES